MQKQLLAFIIVGISLSGLILGSVVIFCFVKAFREAHLLDDGIPGAEYYRGPSYSMEELQRRKDLARSKKQQKRRARNGSADTSITNNTTKRGRSRKPRSRSNSFTSTFRPAATRVMNSISANTSMTHLVPFRRQRSAEDVKLKHVPFYWEKGAMKGKRSGSAPPLRW